MRLANRDLLPLLREEPLLHYYQTKTQDYRVPGTRWQVNGIGDGNTSPDWVVLGPHNVELRAERAGTGTGRIYIITIFSEDTLGNAASQTVTVTVPHDKGH
jgi:hypothetical protein